jgi:hypothetical protein
VLKPRLVIVLICLLIHNFPSSPVSVPYRIKAVITDGQVGLITIPEDEVVENKEYKITYKVRVGKGFDSGDIIPLYLLFDGPVDLVQDFVEVLVK